MKIRCVLEEFMTVIMCSYYFDMGDRYCELTQYKDDGAWYILQIENEKEIYNSFTTAKGCRNMMDYYEDFRRSFHMFSINTWQDVSIRETDMERIFGKRAYTDFLNPEQKKSYLGEFEEKEVCRQYSLNSILIDTTAFQTFGLRMAEGEGLTEQNMALERKTDPIPIVLGNGYQGILNVGDSLELGLFSYVYPCKIAGFLEKGAEVPESGDEMQNQRRTGQKPFRRCPPDMMILPSMCR